MHDAKPSVTQARVDGMDGVSAQAVMAAGAVVAATNAQTAVLLLVLVTGPKAAAMPARMAAATSVANAALSRVVRHGVIHAARHVVSSAASREWKARNSATCAHRVSPANPAKAVVLIGPAVPRIRLDAQPADRRR